MYRIKFGIAAFLLWILLATGFSAIASSREINARVERAERIKSNREYYYGIGYGPTVEEAKRFALDDLCGKISKVVDTQTSMRNTQDDETLDSRSYVSSFVTLSNTEVFVVGENDEKAEVIVYVERAQVENDMAMREDKIRTLAAQGCDLEKRLEIASALKYLNWAYALARANNRPVMIEINGMNHDAKSWLHSKISVMMNTLRFSLENVEERPGELDPYLVNLNVSYLDQPVADLDYSYMNNGNRIYNQHVKNGRASLAFERLPTENIEINVDYRYEDEAEGFDQELKAVIGGNGGKYKFPQAAIQVPCKGSVPDKFRVKEVKLTGEEKRLAEQDALAAPAEVKKPRNRVDTENASASKAEALIAVMEKVKSAVEKKEYSAVKDCFTADGYSLFMRMMRSGNVKIAKSVPDWRVEVAGNFIVGRSIPVTIKYKGGHTVAEDIVFRFNAEDKIESVAYALTRRAEDDIFRQNSWEMSARYAILMFMEDYQTAYALKRDDYISSIFSDDAVIIYGKRDKPLRSNKESGFFFTDEYTYTRSTKDEFLRHLRASFANKDYIKLTFEDNEIRQQGGELFNNVYWIEIRQFYSSSNYNDLGYLTLMIDMRAESPTIKVRTWAPRKIDLGDIMSRYNVE